MGEILNKFLGAAIIYLFFTLPFVHIFKAGVFSYYVLRSKKSPEAICELAEGLHISIEPSPGLGWALTFENAPEDRITTALARLTYGSSLFNIGLGGFFLIAALMGLFIGVWDSTATRDWSGTTIFGTWLAYGIWRFGKIISIYGVLRAKDQQIKTLSLN